MKIMTVFFGMKEISRIRRVENLKAAGDRAVSEMNNQKHQSGTASTSGRRSVITHSRGGTPREREGKEVVASLRLHRVTRANGARI